MIPWIYFVWIVPQMLVLCGMQATASADLPEDADVRKLSVANTQFALDFYKTVVRDKSAIVVSPLSVSVLFTMLYAGANGDTAEEIRRALGYKDVQLKDKTRIQSAYRRVLKPQDSSSISGSTLEVASSLWNSKTFDLSPGYSEVLKSAFYAEHGQLDFERANATETVNNWVSDRTRGKIAKLFEGPLPQNSLLVLVNAVYFKGTWKTIFPLAATRDALFQCGDEEGGNKTVHMMNVRGKFKYFESKALKSKALELDYDGVNCSMVIILPDEDSSLAVTEKRLTSDSLAECLRGLRTHSTVKVSLPRFKMARTHSLIPLLEELGVRKVFASGADLSAMTSQSNAYVSDAVQKAFFQVNEEGTEAAAASGTIMLRSLVPENTFRADRSFLFLIRNLDTNMILFMGRVVSP